MGIYNFKFIDINGEEVSLSEYRGKVLLIVNIASKCGFTPQLQDLQKMYDKYKDLGFEILGFPCNQFANQSPEDNNEFNNFCILNYGVTFNLSSKIDVRGKDSHELFNYLISECPFQGFNKEGINDRILYEVIKENYPELLVGDGIKWNFTKFLIDRNGENIKRYEPNEEFTDILEDLKKFI